MVIAMVAMHDLGALNILRLPLQVLWEFPDIAVKIQQNPAELEEDFVKWFRNYDVEIQKNMLAQLQWAVAHPTYNFTAVLKRVSTSNENILTYFQFIEQIFSKSIKY